MSAHTVFRASGDTAVRPGSWFAVGIVPGLCRLASRHPLLSHLFGTLFQNPLTSRSEMSVAGRSKKLDGLATPRGDQDDPVHG